MTVQQRVRVKFCGFREATDIQHAVALGADALGLVFYPPSKRYVSVEQAVALRQHIPAFVSTVALFVNPSVDEVHEVLARVQPELLQFHGDESPEFCAQFGHPYMKAFRVGGPDTDTAEKLLQQCQLYTQATGWLFDSYSPEYGGTGVRFDVQLLTSVQAYANAQQKAVILAGGLHPENVAEVLAQTPVYAVDVSSGIEVAAGKKSAEKMRSFMLAVAA